MFWLSNKSQGKYVFTFYMLGKKQHQVSSVVQTPHSGVLPVQRRSEILTKRMDATVGEFDCGLSLWHFLIIAKKFSVK